MVTKEQGKKVLDLISKFIPKSNYKKPKHSDGTMFTNASTGEPYVGPYIEDSKGNFIAGESPEIGGPVLKSLAAETLDRLDTSTELAPEILTRTLTQKELQQGSIKRYFSKELYTGDIVEVLPKTYIVDKQDTLRKLAVEVDWRVKGPVKDVLFGKYPHQGAESQNKQAIEKAEKVISGLSTYVSDYTYLVQPIATSVTTVNTSATVNTTAPANTSVTGISSVQNSTNTLSTGTSQITNITPNRMNNVGAIAVADVLTTTPTLINNESNLINITPIGDSPNNINTTSGSVPNNRALTSTYTNATIYIEDLDEDPKSALETLRKASFDLRK